MTTVKELIKFCEEEGFERKDFEVKDKEGNVIGTEPRYFTNYTGDVAYKVIQFSESPSKNGTKTRFFIGKKGCSHRCSFEHIRITEKGIEYWEDERNIHDHESDLWFIAR